MGDRLRWMSLLSPAVSAVIALVGALLAARGYAQGFDWQYMVMSELASSRHNPDGGRWFALALAVSLAVLWPVTSWLRRELPRARVRFGIAALRAGIVLGALTGIERLVLLDASDLFDKSHELLALLSFVCLYAGIVAVCVAQLRGGAERRLPALLLAFFAALGAMLVFLWLGQRELGWVGREWRAMGIPLWRSFAFWQWTAAASVVVAFACFNALRPVPSPPGSSRP